jgi:CheY-like chemotaxis protein
MQPTMILIVDDEPNIRMMFRTALEADGYLISEAGNGLEALDMLQGITPDLMVLDLNMPVMDGMALLEQLQTLPSRQPRPRVIILTAYGSIPTAVKATRLGAIDFLEKPITPEDLRQTIKSILTEPDPEPPAGGQGAPNPYSSVVSQIRRSLQLAEYTSAETMLSQVADRRELNSAEYFNLLGVLYEAQHKWRLARKCYGKAIAASRKYEPAQLNMRRMYELYAFGRSALPVSLGQDADELSTTQTHSKG